MSTLYLWDEQGFYTNTVEVDDAAPMPAHSTPTKPMKLKVGEVAQWVGEWVVTTLPPVVEPEPVIKPVATKAEYIAAIQVKLDAEAKVLNYTNIASAVSYADEPAVPKFQAEGQAFRAWRSLVWVYGYEQLDLVLAGERPQPTVDELVDELPKLVLP